MHEIKIGPDKNNIMSEDIETHILARFDIIKKIGSGAYGHVWKVTDKRTRKIKALKKNFDAFNNSTDAQRTYREIMFLTELSHQHVIKLEEVIKAENNRDIYLVFEHMDIDLYTLIRQDILAERHRKYIFYQMAKALYYLHSAGLIHRDVKPSNVLVNESCEAKLCDFGLVRSIDDEVEQQDILTEYIATRWYRAPQILVGSRRYTKAIDIWSMGCLLAEMQRGKPLFAGTSTMNQLQKVIMWTGPPNQQQIKSLKLTAGHEVFKMLSKLKKCNRRDLVPNANQQCMDLICKMLEFDPQKRISIQQILNHPYLTEFLNKQELVSSKQKIKIAVDDNQRLSLKQYRNIIYQQIRKKNKSSIDITNSTLYRIKHTVRKSQPKKNQSNEHKTLVVEEQSAKKKSFYKRDPVLIGKVRNVKTIEKEWDPIQTKKTLLQKEQKFLNTKFETDYSKKKRSTTEATSQKKPSRLLPSPADFQQRFL